MENNHATQVDAQKRVDQIHAFEKELAELENQAIITIAEEQKSSIEHYHKNLLSLYAETYDIDTTTQAKQLTLGMKIASLLGALAMAISIFFLFHQFWGHINTTIQVAILIIAPIALFVLAIYLTKQEKNSYFSKIAALVSLACFVLNLSMLGQIFNISPSPNAFFVWSAFSFILAYACRARLLTFFGIVFFSNFLAMKVGTWSGMYWISFGEKPENFLLAAIVIFLIPKFFSHKNYCGFDVIYRVMAMIMFFLPLLILSNFGEISYLTWSVNFIEGFYQLSGFVLSTMAIWLGIKQKWPEVINSGNIFFILFLYTKTFDWWWDWMPKYVFFFIIGLIALLALIVFKRLRLSSSNERVTL